MHLPRSLSIYALTSLILLAIYYPARADLTDIPDNLPGHTVTYTVDKEITRHGDFVIRFGDVEQFVLEGYSTLPSAKRAEFDSFCNVLVNRCQFKANWLMSLLNDIRSGLVTKQTLVRQINTDSYLSQHALQLELIRLVRDSFRHTPTASKKLALLTFNRCFVNGY